LVLCFATNVTDVTSRGAATITAGLLVCDRITTKSVTGAFADRLVAVSTLMLCIGTSVEFAALAGAGLAISAGRVNLENAHNWYSSIVLIMRCVWLIAISGSTDIVQC
jgi:hypothetical protein